MTKPTSTQSPKHFSFDGTEFLSKFRSFNNLLDAMNDIVGDMPPAIRKEMGTLLRKIYHHVVSE